jgi:hypothetical protein
MLPVRPCSSLSAASSARMAGGEPSYPTTRNRFPAGGAVAFIAAKAIRSLARRAGISDRRHYGLAHPSWRTYQPARRPPGSRCPLARGEAPVMRTATYTAKLKLAMNTLGFTLLWKPASIVASAATSYSPPRLPEPCSINGDLRSARARTPKHKGSK